MEGPSSMPCKADAVSVEWITSDAGLAVAAGEWSRLIGLDSEFQRTDTFFPKPGLYQLCSGGRVYFLDPLTTGDFSPFLERLEDRSVTKILHACSEDLELLRHHFGAVPVGLFDTQLANAFVTPDYSISFTRLVAERLGITLEQHETRSDWLARPLSETQIQYAWEDVHYLPALHASLAADLAATGRQAWFREEMDQRGRFELGDPELYYLSVKKAWRLDGPARARLQSLTAWREREAIAEDRPRNRLVRDEHLLALAERSRIDDDDLRRLLPPGIARRYRKPLLDAHAEGAARTDHPPPADAPLGVADMALLKTLKAIAQRQAEALGLAPELLGRKRDIEACIRCFAADRTLSEAFLGWREPLLGDAFRACLEAAR